jgi:hypothetical protein
VSVKRYNKIIHEQFKTHCIVERMDVVDKMMQYSPPPKNIEQVIYEYVDRKKGTIFLKLTTW